VLGGDAQSGPLTFRPDFPHRGRHWRLTRGRIRIGGSAASGGAVLIETFSGGVSNSGLVKGDHALLISDVANFSGSVVNAASGTLSARSSAVHIFDVGAFGSGITNSGKILAGATGVLALSNVTSDFQYRFRCRLRHRDEWRLGLFRRHQQQR
jgi:hypothetical protein